MNDRENQEQKKLFYDIVELYKKDYKKKHTLKKN